MKGEWGWMELSKFVMYEAVHDLKEIRECIWEEKKEVGWKSGFGVCGCSYDLES